MCPPSVWVAGIIDHRCDRLYWCRVSLKLNINAECVLLQEPHLDSFCLSGTWGPALEQASSILSSATWWLCLACRLGHVFTISTLTWKQAGLLDCRSIVSTLLWPGRILGAFMPKLFLLRVFWCQISPSSNFWTCEYVITRKTDFL